MVFTLVGTPHGSCQYQGMLFGGLIHDEGHAHASAVHVLEAEHELGCFVSPSTCPEGRWTG